jgi:hypothetical protein
VQTKIHSCWNDEVAAKDVAMEANYITEGDNSVPKIFTSMMMRDNLVIKETLYSLAC